MNEPFKNVFQEVIEGKKRFLNDVIGRSDKKKILDYVKAGLILEVGSGSGVILDMLEDKFPLSPVMGIDISQRVVDSLQRKKEYEDRKWSIGQGNALNLDDFVEPGSLSTIIFCSVIHEVFSYSQLYGDRFNYKTIDTVLTKAFEALKPGGRIIIRDGIMTEPKEKKVLLESMYKSTVPLLQKYAQDFKGRAIEYEVVNDFSAKLPINDAMEFLYTITWGPEAYEYEVNEQYGYYTKSEFSETIKRLFGSNASVLNINSYLQPGYVRNFGGILTLYDVDHNTVNFPDSNCLVVIEKRR